jgi:excisionase family DNA binding protein
MKPIDPEQGAGGNEAGFVTICDHAIYHCTHLQRLLPNGLWERVSRSCVPIDGWYHGTAINHTLACRVNRAPENHVLNHALYDLHEAAAYLNISERTLRRKLDAGQVEYVDFGSAGNKMPRFTKKALDGLITSATVQVRSTTPMASVQSKFPSQRCSRKRQ